ncbi:MAG: hypothetical protein H9893_03385 [Candidatus Niameybacter stercoravium]|nr:hypothetical protein [Candidatus Niameybacter stercoravium]
MAKKIKSNKEIMDYIKTLEIITEVILHFRTYNLQIINPLPEIVKNQEDEKIYLTDSGIPNEVFWCIYKDSDKKTKGKIIDALLLTESHQFTNRFSKKGTVTNKDIKQIGKLFGNNINFYNYICQSQKYLLTEIENGTKELSKNIANTLPFIAF